MGAGSYRAGQEQPETGNLVMAAIKIAGLVKKIGHRRQAKEGVWRMALYWLVPSWDMCQKAQRVPKTFPCHAQAELHCVAFQWELRVRVTLSSGKTSRNVLSLLGLLVLSLFPGRRVSRRCWSRGSAALVMGCISKPATPDRISTGTLFASRGTTFLSKTEFGVNMMSLEASEHKFFSICLCHLILICPWIWKNERFWLTFVPLLPCNFLQLIFWDSDSIPWELLSSFG